MRPPPFSRDELKNRYLSCAPPEMDTEMLNDVLDGVLFRQLSDYKAKLSDDTQLNTAAVATSPS